MEDTEDGTADGGVHAQDTEEGTDTGQPPQNTGQMVFLEKDQEYDRHREGGHELIELDHGQGTELGKDGGQTIG